MTVPTTTAAPQSVVVSYWLYVAGAVLGVIGIVVTLIVLPLSISSVQNAANASGSSNAVDALVAVTVATAIFSIVLGIAYSILFFVFARKMRAGKNWARIVLAVLAAVQIFGVLQSVGVGALHFLVLLAALIFSFVPTSNAYFQSLSTSPARTN